jgi:hypothetical protein
LQQRSGVAKARGRQQRLLSGRPLPLLQAAGAALVILAMLARVADHGMHTRSGRRCNTSLAHSLPWGRDQE